MKRNFLAKNGLADCTLKTIKSDASFRKFFRIKQKHKEFIFFSSPKFKENNTGYIKISKLFFKIGLSVPKILGCAITAHPIPSVASMRS